MQVLLPDGSKLQLEKGASAFDAAMAISPGLARVVCAAKINGETKDLRTILQDGDDLELVKFDSKEGKHAFWHTSAHILADAVKRLFPQAKLAIGPAIDDGFYYDIDLDKTFTGEDLQAIEQEMKKIVKEDIPLVYFSLDRDEALAKVKEAAEPYKQELIEDLPQDAVISFYQQADFTDLCAGPHLMSTGPVKAIKLLHTSGAYWRGSEKNKMLQRIYGVSFPDKKQLKDHLTMLEEARKRDHNKLGRELEYFTTVDFIGQGLPLMMPKGTAVLKTLQRFVEDQELLRGYQQTMTPLMAKSDLYKISGHWDHYRDGMFVLGDPDQEDEDVYALRPMTCPFQYQIYKAATRSYRDLPIRLSETSTLFRNEASGEMHGLIRLRQFTISEAHLMVRPDQLEDEFNSCLDLAIFMLKAMGLDDDVSFRFSTWDPEDKDKYLGTKDQWDAAQDAMAKILEDNHLSYEVGVGEAAFYGPKLDIQIRNVFGKEDTLITIQVDMQLAERFDMLYTDKDGQRRHPYIIHRTSVGCYERTLALLIEKYAGALPLWLAPEQVRILAISEKHRAAAEKAKQDFLQAGFRVTCDLRDEKIGKKIRDAQMEKVPYMLVLGDQEVAENNFAVRHRKHGPLDKMTFDQLTARLRQEVADFCKD